MKKSGDSVKSAKSASKAKKAETAKKRAEKELERAQKDKLRAESNRIRAERKKAKSAARAAIYKKLRVKLSNIPYGFDYKNDGFIPRAELTVRGDAASVVARLGKNGISVFDIEKNGAFITFKIRKKDLHKAIAILNEMCYTFKVGQTLGITRLGAFCLSRVGLFVGAALAIAAINVSYSYIWRLEIAGNERLSTETIRSALESEGVCVGLKKRSLDLGSVASAVEKTDGVSDASAEIVGTTLRVNVLESVNHTVRSAAGAYVSDHDATVTRIVLRRGTSHVKRGDVVKKGDWLADGHVYSTAGELLYTGDCDAEVYGNISVTYDAKLSTAAVEYRRTGRVKRKTTFELFGLKLFKADSPYALYEMSSTTAHYDVLLPLYAAMYEFYELERVEVERDIDDAVRQYAAEKLEELGRGELTYSYTVTESHAGLYAVHLFLSGEVCISRGVKEPPPPVQTPSE